MNHDSSLPLRATRRWIAGLLLLASATVFAQADGARGSTEAEVRSVDRDTGKVTLRHGDVPALEMPGMTMVFSVEPPTLLDGIERGQRVGVQIEYRGGRYRVVAIEPLR